MKKMIELNAGLFVLLFTCLSFFACSNDSDNYPEDYVGFEHSSHTVECNKQTSESELQIKIIAVKKSKEDRVMELTTSKLLPGQIPVMKLTENKVTIKAGAKSVTTTIKLFPEQMILKQQNVIIMCTPQWKDSKMSKLTILLKQK